MAWFTNISELSQLFSHNLSKMWSLALFFQLFTSYGAIEFAEIGQCCGEYLDIPERLLKMLHTLRLKCWNLIAWTAS